MTERHGLPVLELSKSNFDDDVFEDDASHDVSGDDGEKDPAEVLEPGRRQQQLEHAFHWSVILHQILNVTKLIKLECNKIPQSW